MTANELLFHITRETGSANRIVEELVRRSSSDEPLLVRDCKTSVQDLDGHLRRAASAASALRSMAEGFAEPKQG